VHGLSVKVLDSWPVGFWISCEPSRCTNDEINPIVLYIDIGSYVTWWVYRYISSAVCLYSPIRLYPPPLVFQHNRSLVLFLYVNRRQVFIICLVLMSLNPNRHEPSLLSINLSLYSPIGACFKMALDKETKQCVWTAFLPWTTVGWVHFFLLILKFACLRHQGNMKGSGPLKTSAFCIFINFSVRCHLALLRQSYLNSIVMH